MIPTSINSMTPRPNPETQKIIPISLSFNGRQVNFTIFLDISKFGQKLMWGHFTKGRLNEPETSQFVIFALKPGDCFIDIGAHIGYFSFLAAALVGTNGRVISFEPDESNFNHLNKNMVLNRFLNIHARNQALGSIVEEKTFFINSDADGGHAFWDVGKHPFNKKSRIHKKTRRVPVETIDSIMDHNPVPNLKLIKIDTEGAEHAILQGGMDTIQRQKIPYIICEVNRFGLEQMGSDEFSFRSFVEDLGYHTHLLADGRNGPAIIPLGEKQTLDTNSVFNLLFIRDGMDLPEEYRKESLK